MKHFLLQPYRWIRNKSAAVQIEKVSCQTMKITYSNSQEISERIGAILNKNVNIMDEEGIIVASTDPSRIGMLHVGARKLIERNDIEMDIYPEENLRGMKEGINVPIHIDGRTIGVIGVTGNPDELRDIALVIGEMANIMFMNTQQSMRSENLARQKRLFCEELLLNPHLSKDSDLPVRAAELEFPLERIQSVGVFHISDQVSEADRLAIDDQLTGLLRTALGESVYLHHHHIGQNLAIVFHFTAKSPAIGHINRILANISSEWHRNIFCGLSCSIENFTQISHAYSCAEKAMEIASRTGLRQCLIYEELALEIITAQISESCRSSFLRNVWKTKDTQQIQKAAEFLNVYFDANGSLELISKKLYIHKNTVQYKIKKVIELTGYDPRIIHDAAVLLLACKLL